MKRFFLLVLLATFAFAAESQVQIFNGTDTIGNGRTLTSEVITLGNYPTQFWPISQVFMDYKSGTANVAVVGWYSLDGVRYDTIPGFYTNYDAEADGTFITTTTTWESPVMAKYVKFTARGHTGTQSLTPKGYFWYKKVP